MREATIWDMLRDWISAVAFRVFLWANRRTEDQYHALIVEGERLEIARKLRCIGTVYGNGGHTHRQQMLNAIAEEIQEGNLAARAEPSRAKGSK
jgi:hypothetical protein